MRDRVLFGATVTYIDETGTEHTVTIVGSDEADMARGTISLTSPVAVALIKIRARVGDEVAVHTPKGVQLIEVLRVSYPPTQVSEVALDWNRLGWIAVLSACAVGRLLRRLRRADLRRLHRFGHAIEHDNPMAPTTGRNALIRLAVA